MKKNGKKKRLICLIAVFCMMLQSFSIVNAFAADITINATNAANGVSLSWNASDFGGAAEYTLYRDGLPLATVNAENTNATLSNGTWTYNDVYFNTLEQKLGELSGKDSAALDTDHTYYVKAGNVTSTIVTGKPDPTKLVYFTFSGVTNTTDWNNVNINKNGIVFNKFVSTQAKQNTTASPLNATDDYKAYTSRYTIESLTTKTHRGFSFIGTIDDKIAGGLVAAKTGDTSVPYASYIQFNIESTGYDYFYSDTANRDYTAWVNASIVDNKMIANVCFGDLCSTGEVIPDSENSTITYKYGKNNTSFAFDIGDNLSGKDRYATYKFTVSRQFNSSNKYLNFYAYSSSDNAQGVRTSDAVYYDADGEQAAIHSIALMRTADCLSGSVKDEYSGGPSITVANKANGVTISWNINDFNNAATYEIYRDNAKIADVTAANCTVDTVLGQYTYGDVYFETVEQMRREGGKAPYVSLENHTYYVQTKDGSVKSKSATATADTSKIIYFTFADSESFEADANAWNNINKGDHGIGLNKYASAGYRVTKGLSQDFGGSLTGSTLYSVPASGMIDRAASHNAVSYFGEMYGKAAAGLVAAKKDDGVAWATGYQFYIKEEFGGTTEQDYTIWMNASFKDNAYISNACLGNMISNGEAVPDDENAEIDVYVDSTNAVFKPSFTTSNPTSTYATYKFNINRAFDNSSNKYLGLRSAGTSNSAGSISADNLQNYNSDGEMGAIHSLAIMNKDDYVAPAKVIDADTAQKNVDDTYNVLEIYREDETSDAPLDANGIGGAKITWSSSNTAVVDNNGKVYPKVGQAQSATLTATISLDGVTRTKEFTINVPAVMPFIIDGIKVTGSDNIVDTTLVGGKTISAVKVRRYENTLASVTAFAALYDGNALVDVATTTVSPGMEQYKNGDITFTTGLTLPTTLKSTHSVRVFLLDSTKNLVPLAESYCVRQIG